MNKFIYFLFCVSLFLLPGHMSAQNVTVDAQIDSVQRLIGQQAKIKIEVTANSDSRIVMPTFDKEIIEGVEIVHKAEPDTLYLNDRKRMEITDVYTVTSFDSALYMIPAFEILVDGDPYYTRELALAVYMMPIDTTNLDSFFGPKDIWHTNLMWDDCKESFWNLNAEKDDEQQTEAIHGLGTRLVSAED